MRTLVGIIVVSSAAAFAQPPNPRTLQPPDPEILVPAAPVALPAIPTFDMPASEPGFVGVHQLRVMAHKHFDTDVKVKGYVVWIYDCVVANAKRGESRAATKKRIEADPTICERMKFYLGQTPTEEPAIGLWIVDVPRPPNKIERERLPKEEIAAWPKVPKVKLGDFVVVSGKFTTASPHSERNSDGLVVFAAVEPAKKPPATKPTFVSPATRPAVAAPATKPVPASTTDIPARDRSVKLSNEGTRAYLARTFPEAIAAYTKAVAEWPGNHVAYYGLAGAYMGMKKWAGAGDAMARAVEIEPSVAMYHMVYGYVLYEKALAEATEAEAKRANLKPEQVTVDRSTINHERALVHLSHATKLEPKLWRAHYYIGRIHRDRGEARWAAESLDAALRSAPRDPGPWIALGELYRRWYYTDQALAVAKAGTVNVSGANSSDIWYVLAMSHDDKRDYARSIEGFTKALEARPDNAKATFQRGQALFRTGNFAKAKVDLEAYSASASPDAFAKVQANKMLLDIAAKRPGNPK